MKNGILAAAVLTLVSGGAFAQGATGNMNAPQPSSDGRGVYVPGTTSTGTAVDRTDTNGSITKSGGTVGSAPMARGNNAELMGNTGTSAQGSNSLGHIQGGNSGSGR